MDRLKKGDFEIFEEKLETLDFKKSKRNDNNAMKRSEAMQEVVQINLLQVELKLKLQVAPSTIICVNITI